MVANIADDIENFVKKYRAEVLVPFFKNNDDCDMAEYIVLELMNNSYEHGNKRNPQKKITVEWRVDRDKLYISVEDEGEGFEPDIPETLPPLNHPRGRGLWSIKQDAESFEYSNNGKKATVTIKARRAR